MLMVKGNRRMVRRTTPAPLRWLRRVQRPHVAMVAVLGLGLALLAAAPSPAPAHSSPVTALAVTLPGQSVAAGADEARVTRTDAAATQPRPENAAPAPVLVSEAELQGPLPPARTRREVPVRKGDSLARIFKREGLAASTLHRIVTSGPEAAGLKRIHPGQTLSLEIDEIGRVLAVRYALSPLEEVAIDLEREGYAARLIRRDPEVRTRYTEGVITSSLFLAGRDAGLSEPMVMALANIFQWDVDFVLDIRAGDQFRLVYETRHLDGEYIGDGAILSAEFVNRGERFAAVRFEDDDGYASYYAPTGEPMRKAFLRAPVKFSRISSSFNPRRRHPITRTVRPHRGIDYVAPRGTPILAAGDGKVVRARNHQYNGNYVVIQHGEQYQTKYLHLSGFGRKIKEGRRVQQGQVIGYVGATGLATGAHLHYEFLVNGVHRNPRTVPLPKATPIDPDDLPRFLAQTRPRLEQLEQFAQIARVDTAAAP